MPLLTRLTGPSAASATLNIASGAAFLSGNGAITVGGTSVITGTYTVSGTGGTTFTGNVTLNGGLNGSGSGSVTAVGSVTGSGAVNLTADTFEQRVAAAQNFGATSGSNPWIFNNLTFSDSSAGSAFTVTTLTGGSGGITVNGILTLDRGTDTKVLTLNPGNQTWTFTNTGTPIVFNVLSVICPPGTCGSNSSTFDFTANGAVTIPASLGYYNVTLNPTITSPITYTLGGAVTAFNNFISSPSATSPNALTVNLGGVLTVSNGTLILDGSGTGPTPIPS